MQIVMGLVSMVVRGIGPLRSCRMSVTDGDFAGRGQCYIAYGNEGIGFLFGGLLFARIIISETETPQDSPNLETEDNSDRPANVLDAAFPERGGDAAGIYRPDQLC